LGVTRSHRRGFPCCVGSPCAGMPPPIPRWNPGACRIVRGYPLPSPGRRPSPYSNRVGFHIGLFRGLHGVHLRCGLPARRAAEAARCLEGFDGFVTSAAAPIATGWSDQLSGWESHPLEIRALARRTATHTPTVMSSDSRNEAGSRPSLRHSFVAAFLLHYPLQCGRGFDDDSP
jgi:hypothetical protein